jgi:hypothetical protein
MEGLPLTDQRLTGDGDMVLPLHALIRLRMDERGWSYGQLAHRSHGRLTKSRWQQLGTAVRMKEFPELATVKLLSDVLEVDETTIVLSVASSLGLNARFRGGPMLAQLLPAGTDLLEDRMRDAILGIIRAAVAEAVARVDAAEEAGHAAHAESETYEWARSASADVRNTGERTSEHPA